ncbi:hypothetical protein GGI43DRAFT_418905 [Trichoderma evansii]
MCQINSQARLGTTFSIFFNVVLRLVTTLATRRPGSQLKTTEPIFDELLALAHKLEQLKAEVNQQLLNDFLMKTP